MVNSSLKCASHTFFDNVQCLHYQVNKNKLLIAANKHLKRFSFAGLQQLPVQKSDRHYCPHLQLQENQLNAWAEMTSTVKLDLFVTLLIHT